MNRAHPLKVTSHARAGEIFDIPEIAFCTDLFGAEWSYVNLTSYVAYGMAFYCLSWIGLVVLCIASESSGILCTLS